MESPASLNHVTYPGSGTESFVVLHGLLGSARNWTAAAKLMSASGDVHVLDLRNHGKSEHRDSMEYEAMARDVLAWADECGLSSFHLVGHSMGGKVAMKISALEPARLRSLIVLDISPRGYTPHHRIEMNAMQALPLDIVQSRKEAESYLEQAGLKDLAMRQFILTNLVRDSETKKFCWQLNVTALDRGMEAISAAPLDAGERYCGPTLFFRGGQADFVRDSDFGIIRSFFPTAEIITIEDSAHNVHVDGRDAFVGKVLSFIGAISDA